MTDLHDACTTKKMAERKRLQPESARQSFGCRCYDGEQMGKRREINPTISSFGSGVSEKEGITSKLHCRG